MDGRDVSKLKPNSCIATPGPKYLRIFTRIVTELCTDANEVKPYRLSFLRSVVQVYHFKVFLLSSCSLTHLPTTCSAYLIRLYLAIPKIHTAVMIHDLLHRSWSVRIFRMNFLPQYSGSSLVHT